MEIVKWSATKIRHEISKKTMSCLDVAEAHLAHARAVNVDLNALTLITDEEALKTAGELDQKSDDGSQLLRGVPITTKINIDHAGYPNSNGVETFSENISNNDAALVQNMKNDGAITIGRSNTPEFSMRWCTSNPLHGVTLNPWNTAITPGGSSGGAAAAVASNIGAIAHGNDLGGSLRYPAFCCGVASIKPSSGTVPSFNPSAPNARPPLTQTMSVQGPIARNIADVRLGLSSMMKYSRHDPLWVRANESRHSDNQRIKIGFSKRPFDINGYDIEVDKAMDIAIQGLKDAGCNVVEMLFPHADEIASLWGDMLFTETNMFMSDIVDDHGSDDMKTLVSNYKDYFNLLDLDGFLKGMHDRLIFQRNVSEMFGDIDIFLMPTSMVRPFENDADFKYPHIIPHIIEAQKPLHLVNILSLPSVAIPTHLAGRTPLGVQMITRIHDDLFALDVAERLEREIGTLLD